MSLCRMFAGLVKSGSNACYRIEFMSKAMASSYKGLYVQRLSDGTIHSVQVVDPGGNSIPLDPQTYIDREVEPTIEKLPDLENYRKST